MRNICAALALTALLFTASALAADTQVTYHQVDSGVLLFLDTTIHDADAFLTCIEYSYPGEQKVMTCLIAPRASVFPMGQMHSAYAVFPLSRSGYSVLMVQATPIKRYSVVHVDSPSIGVRY